MVLEFLDERQRLIPGPRSLDRNRLITDHGRSSAIPRNRRFGPTAANFLLIVVVSTACGVNGEERDATVTFDDEKTTVEALTQATTNAGYPSTLKQSQAKQE